MWRTGLPLKKRYDVVIIGGGVQGLATAYYLAKNHGITDVAVLEKSYIGSGGSGRNTAIVRSNYRTPEGASFYQASLDLYDDLSAELDFNIMLTKRGVLSLAHSERALATATERASVNQKLGIDSRVIGLDEVRRRVPALNTSDDVTWPVMGALLHPGGAILRHDAVVWGYGRGADRRGVEIHPFTEVTGLDTSGDRVTKIRTSRGDIEAGTVLSATAGWSSGICKMVGLRLPMKTYVLQAFVTEPIRPLLVETVVSTQMRLYVHQTTRGELVAGAEAEPYPTYQGRSTLTFIESISRYLVELFPAIRDVGILRTWSGLCDVTPDYSPIIDRTPLSNFIVSAGWGTYGFKAAPIVGVTVAKMIATDRVDPLIEPFGLQRFTTDRLVSEAASAAMSH
ncbi:MAG: sarcosine oxidase subunit beta [Solirubrobacterales bacterium 70-9]|nr:MAG: sarcosine oxidase subunit beta [Solirubrobacterales bacterium 70-9]